MADMVRETHLAQDLHKVHRYCVHEANARAFGQLCLQPVPSDSERVFSMLWQRGVDFMQHHRWPLPRGHAQAPLAGLLDIIERSPQGLVEHEVGDVCDGSAAQQHSQVFRSKCRTRDKLIEKQPWPLRRGILAKAAARILEQ